MNFLEAVKAMKEGKKVKRKSFQYYLKFDESHSKHISWDLNSAPSYIINLDDCEATDWQIVEEKKTLGAEEKLSKIKEILGD